MTPQGRRIWGSRQGQSLMRALLAGGPLNPIHQEAVAALKSAPPKEPRAVRSKPK